MENCDMTKDFETIVEKQRKYFLEGNTRNVLDRLDAIGRLERFVTSSRDEILEALEEDLGKPSLEAFLAEYYFLLQEIRMVQKSLEKWVKPVGVRSPIYFMPCKSRVELSPFGVVLVVAPWNYPIQLALSPLLAAVAAGNTVVLKPSEVSSASERFLTKLVQECFCDEHVTVVTGGVEVSQALLKLRYDFIFFTGSTSVGRIVAQESAKNLTPTVLELGGKCPCVIDEGVDLEMSVRRILTGKFFNAGQTCFAPDFVAVQESMREGFVDACAKVLEETPWNEEMACIVDEKNYVRLQGLLNNVEGGGVMQQGEDDDSKCFISPRVLSDCEWGDEVMRDEIFGPILPVVTYVDEADVLKKLGQYSSPLALYLFSESEPWLRRVMDTLPSGGVCINDTMKQGSSLHLPFGGVGESGHGRYRGKAGVTAMSYQRSIVKRSKRSFKMFDIMPPYQKAYDMMTKWMK